MITIADFKQNVLDVAGSSLDDEIQIIIDTSIEVIERLCNQVILKKETVIEQFNYDSMILLTNYNVPIDFDSVEVLRKSKISNTYTNDDDFMIQKIRSSSYVVNADSDYTSTFVKVSWEQGFEIADVPESIKNVSRNICFILWQNSRNSVDSRRLGVNSVSVNQGGVTTTQTFQDLEKKWKQELSKYRLICR